MIKTEPESMDSIEQIEPMDPLGLADPIRSTDPIGSLSRPTNSIGPLSRPTDSIGPLSHSHRSFKKEERGLDRRMLSSTIDYSIEPIEPSYPIEPIDPSYPIEPIDPTRPIGLSKPIVPTNSLGYADKRKNFKIPLDYFKDEEGKKIETSEQLRDRIMAESIKLSMKAKKSPGRPKKKAKLS